MIIEKATVSDAEELLALQKLAYRSEAEIYNDFSIPPLIQTLESMEEDFKNQLFLKARPGWENHRVCQGVFKRGDLLYRKTDCSSRFSESRDWNKADE